MRLIIVRHGETIENKNGIIQGQNPGSLTLNGKKQAQKLALRLKHEPIDFLYSSDLKRSEETTREIAKFHAAPVIYTEMLRERSMGIFEGKLKEECRRAEKECSYSSFVPENGESYEDFEKRVKFFVNYILLKHPNKTVLVSSHTRFIKIMLSIILRKKMDEVLLIPQFNACVNILEIKEKEKSQIFALNSTYHLL